MRQESMSEARGIIAPIGARYRKQDYDLANVTPDQVRATLRGVRNGRLDDQDRLFRLMLDSWSRLRKCQNEVASAVASVPIEIKPCIVEGASEPTQEAIDIANTVRRALEAYAPRPAYWELGKRDMIKALVDAYAKGISVLEIVWQLKDGIVSPRCYSPVPARYLSYTQAQNEDDRLMLAPGGVYSSALEDFPAHRFIIGVWNSGSGHPMHAANIRSLSKYWLAAIYGLGWLMQYAQLYGIPFRQAKTDGTTEADAKAREMLENIGSGGWAVTSKDVEIEMGSPPSGSASELPQSQLMREADNACDILMLGQTLTTDVSSSGSRALGDVHANVRADVLASVAKWVEEIITTQIIPAIVALNYGENIPQSSIPYCSMELPAPKDEKAVAERAKVITEIGLPVTTAWIYEELGIPQPEPGQEVFVPGSIPTTPEPVTAAAADIDTKPTQAMADNAARALEVRRSKPASERGMTAVGIARARDISNRADLSLDTVKRMKAYFDRHEVDKDGSTWSEQGKGWQAWMGWGGDEGRAWAEKIINKSNA
jgi:phage gp29-like protein